MSLARIALRIAAVEAIRGRTEVDQNVLDSPNGALDVQADGTLRINEERPFVSVYTDASVAEGVSGSSLIENGNCMLVIEAGVSMSMSNLDDETGASTIVGIPASDRSFEFYLDIVQRQIFDALSDPDNEWGEIYRGLVVRVLKVEIGAKQNSDDGQRLAGHQSRITVELIDDPLKGEQLDPASPFGRFFKAMLATADPIYHRQAEIMAGLVGGSDPDWKSLQRRRGMTRAELLAVGLGPLGNDLERSTPTFEDAVSAIEGNEPAVVTP